MRTLLLGLAWVLLSACASAREPAMVLIPVGENAPAFAALDQAGAKRTLAEFSGRPLVVYFYPRDGTPGCTKEACAFRDVWQQYEAAGVAIVGVSTDDVAAHARFASEHNLPFPLLADTEGAMARAFGVDVTLKMAKRVTFLVDPEGRVAHVFPNVDPGVHAAQVLVEAKKLSRSTSSPATEAAN